MLTTDALEKIVEPTYACLLPGRFASREASVLLLAIGLQESGFQARQPGRDGAGRGYWRMEQRAVHAVLGTESTRLTARAVCLLRALAPTDGDVYRGIGHDDMLAFALARLLLWTEGTKLPSVGDADGAFRAYQRCWPGATSDGWAEHYALAMRVVA